MREYKPKGPVDRLSLAISRVVMLLIAWVVAIMFYEVVMRYVFVRPTLWVNEMSLWIAGMIYLLSGLYALQQRTHIRITLLYDAVPRGVQKLFDVLSTLFTCLFATAVIYGGFNEAWRKFIRWETFGTAWDPPIPATIKPLILVTVFLIAVQSLSNLITDWKVPKMHAKNVEDETLISAQTPRAQN